MGFPQHENQYQQATGGLAGAGARVDQGPAKRLAFVRKVYLTLLQGLAVGSVGGVIGAMNAEVILGSGMLNGFLIAEMIFFFVTLMLRRKPFWNKLFFFGFNASFGAFIGTLYPVLASQGESFVFWQAVGATIAIFGGLTAYVFATRTDFRFMGGMLFMGCWSMFFAGLFSLFFGGGLVQSTLWQFLGMLLVSGFVLFDTSNVLHHYEDGDEVAAALELAWDFWYMLFRLIMIFADRD